MPQYKGAKTEIYRNGTSDEQLKYLSKYFKAYFSHQNNNWFNYQFKQRMVKARMCEFEDFDKDEISR